MALNSIATNTLLIPNLPSSFFVGAQPLQKIRNECERYGTLHQFIPLKGFGRVMVIYVDTQCSIATKVDLDEAYVYWIECPSSNPKKALILGFDTGLNNKEQLNANLQKYSTIPYSSMCMRFYFGQHNPICPDPATFNLQVPDTGRNLLISPPGDPCQDWKSRTESPPNKAILASDLLRALTTVDGDDDVDGDSIDDFRLDEGPVATVDELFPESSLLPPTVNNTTHSDTSTLQLNFNQDNLPTIKIQDMDGSLLTQHQEKTNRQKPPATARPPIRT